ncbi:MAG: glycine cleavage system protein GcvH [Erysipelotrichaceae bacterium]|nr:glycine cleavage system protein GcvH [Erysipelotrichaceae bacterium]
MNLPKELNYTKTHEWVKWLDETTVLVGITDHAQESLGDIVFINLPEIDQQLTKDAAFGDVESVKAVSEVYSPVSGKVTKINEAILDSPEKVNQDPYGSWFMEVSEVNDKTALLTNEQYQSVITEE